MRGGRVGRDKKVCNLAFVVCCEVVCSVTQQVASCTELRWGVRDQEENFSVVYILEKEKVGEKTESVLTATMSEVEPEGVGW